MGVPPRGKIVERPMLARSCGCVQEFQYYEVDKFRAQRQAKFQRTRCPACAAKVAEDQRLLPKGEALNALPEGTQMTLVLQPGGFWTGTLSAAGKSVESTGVENAGPQSVVVALARQWVKEHGGRAGAGPDQSVG
jgi:hypothetical protein